jgi:hypothetical protein
MNNREIFTFDVVALEFAISPTHNFGPYVYHDQRINSMFQYFKDIFEVSQLHCETFQIPLKHLFQQL